MSDEQVSAAGQDLQVPANASNDPDALYKIGVEALQNGRFDVAAKALERAIRLRAPFPEAHLNLGLLLRIVSTHAAAAESFETAVRQAPDHVDARYELAIAYLDLHRLADAEREMRTVLRLRPDYAKAHSALGMILLKGGRTVEAVTAFADAMSADPDYMNAATNWVNAQQYIPGVGEETLAESHAVWAALHAPDAVRRVFSNPRTTDRPLKVGFISPDFGMHPVGILSVRLFENLDRSLIRPIVFSMRPQVYEDEISARIAHATSWSTMFGLSDEDLAAFVAASGIDILFDMSGHTAHHRLRTFALRAAPVQVSWLGYTGTTGLAEMDYIMANGRLAPPGTEAHYSERFIRLPHWHACFDPPADAPPVGPLPAAKNGVITFGCLNNPAKVSDEAIVSYARILGRVPGSRLKLRYKSLSDPNVQARLRAAFSKQGIDDERIDISGHAPRGEFLATYNEIDIVLDTFPYSGCLTTCEATWMGCPVIAFPGATFAGRQSASYLAAAGLERLIAPDRLGFEDLAVDLAHDSAGLTSLRSGLRGRIAASPVCDGPGFARDFTAAMRQIWADWCVAASA